VDGSTVYTLRQLTLDDAAERAALQVPAAWAVHADARALMPPHVAARSLRQIAEGQSAAWCLGFAIVRHADQRIVGACGFKHEPEAGRVEIGYSIAPACQGQGAASAAVRQLLALARAGGVTEVLAEVSPANAASTAVVYKLGFARIGTRVDEDGETVVQWLA
jgi:RimJ/RimL family protein N-acetyltransferase